MSDTPNTTDSLELAKDAINYTLQRIQQDENIRYHMGAFTEAFERLKTAHCALNGLSEEAVEEQIFSYKLKYKSNAEKLTAIKELIDSTDEYEQTELTKKIRELCRG